MKNRVIIVYDFAFINGGQAKVAIDSARLLAESGIKVTYFAAVGPIDDSLQHDLIDVELIGQHDILTEPSKLRVRTH